MMMTMMIKSQQTKTITTIKSNYCGLIRTISTMKMMLRLLLPILLLEISCKLPSVVGNVVWRQSSRRIHIINDSGKIVELFWYNPQTQEEVLTSTPHILPSAEFTSNSYVGHQFIVREKSTKRRPCRNPNEESNNDDDDDAATITTDQQQQQPECQHTWITVSSNGDQVARLNREFDIEFVDSGIKAQRKAEQLVENCKTLADNKDNVTYSSVAVIDDLISCIQTSLSESLEEAEEELGFHASVRRDIADRMEDYACNDPYLETTPDIDVKEWSDPKEEQGLTRSVHVKHDRPSSKIHVIENFISPDECEAVENTAAPLLQAATVADGKGGDVLERNRKAMQAGIEVPWEMEEAGDPIARLSRRVYDYANHVLHLNIDEHGQEDLMSIQYFGRGRDDKEPDRYMPHCDESCTAMPHQHASRVATMVLYCRVADVGGHTNFQNAGVHVQPNIGDAIFFSYIDPATMMKDAGFTLHSGCPVYEGHKHIVTQWIRYGVDSENPWDSFDSNNMKISDMKVIQEYLGEDEELGELEAGGEWEEDDDDDEEEDEEQDEYAGDGEYFGDEL